MASPPMLALAIHQAIAITKDANQDETVMTADLKIYKVIGAILFHSPELLTVLIPHIGRLHFIMD